MTGYVILSGGSKPPPYIPQLFVILSEAQRSRRIRNTRKEKRIPRCASLTRNDKEYVILSAAQRSRRIRKTRKKNDFPLPFV